MKIRRPGPLVCYLLHFDKPVGRARHYLGSTFESHLPARLRSHAKGRGAALTSAAVEGGTRFALAAVWRVDSREEEARAKRAGHFNKRCPICRGTTDLDQAQFIAFDPHDTSAWSDLHWTADSGLRGGSSKA